jgi:microcystin-dependent protein
MSDPFIAEIKIFPGNFAPRNWAFCDGQLLPIAQNTALFSLVGTTYGGDGRTTFGVPDLRGRAPMNPRNGPGLTSRRLGERGGVENVTLTQAQMPAHNHTLQASGTAVDEEGTSNPADAVTGVTDLSDAIYGPAGATTQMHPSALASVGGGQMHNNMQPFLALNFIIALVGVFPSRS